MTLIYIVSASKILKTTVRIVSVGVGWKKLEDYTFESKDIQLSKLTALRDFLIKHVQLREDITVFLGDDVLFNSYNQIINNQSINDFCLDKWKKVMDRLSRYFYIPVIRNKSFLAKNIEEDLLNQIKGEALSE